MTRQTPRTDTAGSSWQTPEQRELDRRKSALATLEGELAERELATLQGALRAFEMGYIRRVGTLYAQLDELNAQIAETLARRNLKDPRLRKDAAATRAKAAETAVTLDFIRDASQGERFVPGEDLKRLYREIARRLHPDLATDDNERVHRNHAMAEANLAYAAGDDVKLRAILEDWHSSPESVKG